MKQTLVVDNLQYFRAVDSEVRKHMKRFEAGLLPIARQAVKDAGFPVKDVPIEGYYHENPELREYFTLIRTLQDNFTKKITPTIEKLHDVYTHPIFGLGQGRPTAISDRDNKKVMYPNEPYSTVSQVADPVSVASMKIMPNWTIERIMAEVDKLNLGTCLVGLALLVDTESPSNPLATCMACETTVLSRMKAIARGASPMPEVEWRVSREVEEYGERVIKGYNDLFKNYAASGLEAEKVTPKNAALILENVPPLERCVNINIDATRIDGYYHWAIEHDGERHVVLEFWSSHIVTTKDWQRNRSAVEYNAEAQNKCGKASRAIEIQEGEIPVFSTTGRLLDIRRKKKS